MSGDEGGRSLEETPTWAVAVVCFVLVLISIIIDYIIQLIGKWFKKKNKRALYESLEKIKSELMLMGFISLLLTVGQGLISDICISKSAADTWHPCSKKEDDIGNTKVSDNQRKLLASLDSDNIFRRILAGGTSEDKCASKGKVSFVSTEGIHQLHIFIFVLACFHILYSVLTMGLGGLKMRKWKHWEKETKTIQYRYANDPERFRFARETSFGKRHLRFWTNNPVLIWIVCFFRQFVHSVPKIDYSTLRHGFIMAHLAPTSTTHFNFQKYINRTLEEDFKVVVGISPPIWFLGVLFILFNTHGVYSYLWLPFIPLVIVLLVGTKLQVIITKMGLKIEDRGEVVKGLPVVEPGDDLFWFNRPRLILYIINFILFQNAFQVAYFIWTWGEFGFQSCFHPNLDDVIIRITTGILVQILCSYVTLPLYALVTQMGSNMKPTVFNDGVAKAIRNWHHRAKKNVELSKTSSPITPMSASPVHLLRHYRGQDQLDDISLEASPKRSLDQQYWDSDDSSSPSNNDDEGSSSHHIDVSKVENEPGSASLAAVEGGRNVLADQYSDVEIDIMHKDFSFPRKEIV